MQATTTSAAPATLGGQLERRRLEHRAQRLHLTILALRERRSIAATAGRVPRPLQQAIGDFSAELASIEKYLGASPAQKHRRWANR